MRKTCVSFAAKNRERESEKAGECRPGEEREKGREV